MEQQRGRSPSGGHHQTHLNHSQSPPPQQYPDNINSNNLGLGIDSTLAGSNNYPQFTNDSYPVSQNISSFDNNSGFLGNQQDHQFSQSGLDNSNFNQNQDFNLQSNFNQQFKQDDSLSFEGQQSFTQDLLNPNNFNEDFSLYTGGQNDQVDPNFFLNDPSQEPSGNSVNPADLMSDMSSPLPHTPTPPHLLHPDGPQSSSAQHSPSFNQHQFQHSPAHSRNTSLGPESAAFPQGHQPGMPNEWNLMQPQFTTHRRTPSEYSDVSASSVTHSPNLVQQDSFDLPDQRHSPMVNPQDPGLYQELHGIQNFSLSEPQAQHAASPHHGLSPAHTPAGSPRLGPQQGPLMNQQSPFSLNMSLSNNGFIPTSGSEIYPGQTQAEMGQAQQMPPPEIKFEFAPASRQNSFEPQKPSLDQDALTPPDRGRGRRRAVSDPYNTGSGISQSGSPSSMSPGVGSDIGSLSPQPARSLSPLPRSDTASPSSRRRQSTSSLPNREYILGLARDPDQSPGSAENGNAKRVQKHPATFQCTLCPKRFTRAYNLRSHLRTHTDERPFVCTVCGKAFARQHDRKRHEGLHSGEKKFVCKGELKTGGQWGCGRRFARADALGRHFRSEAGRICIKPLLDEEAIERQRAWQEQQLQSMAQNMQQPQIAVDANGFPMDASGNYTLPAALLAQYPALANLSWADLPQGDAAMEDDVSGRSSFDASGSEFYDEADDGGYVSGPGTGFGPGQQMSEGYEVGYVSDYGGR